MMGVLAGWRGGVGVIAAVDEEEEKKENRDLVLERAVEGAEVDPFEEAVGGPTKDEEVW